MTVRIRLRHSSGVCPKTPKSHSHLVTGTLKSILLFKSVKAYRLKRLDFISESPIETVSFALFFNRLAAREDFPFNPLPPFKGSKCPLSRNSTGKGRLCTTSRSEEHTSELQSRFDLVCRLLLDR